MKRIEVTATRLSPGADVRDAARVDAVDVQRTPPGPASTAKALSRLPGVSVTNDQGTRAQPTVEFRGFTLSPVAGVPQGISVFLDGVRVNEPDAQEVNFDLLPIAAVAHAELLRGPSAIFGKNTLGGTLNLVTVRGGASPRLALTTEAGSFGYRGIHLLASGARMGMDGSILISGSTEDGYQLQSGTTTRQLFSTLGRKGHSGDLALSLLYAHDRISEAGSLPESWLMVDRRANYSAGDFFSPDLVQLTVRGSKDIGGSTLRGNVFTRRNAAEQFNVNAQDPNTRAFVTNNSLGATAELDVPTMVAGRPVALSFGGEYAHTRVKYRVFGEPNMAAPDLAPDCNVTSGLCEDARVNGDDVGLFAQALVELTDRLSLLASARGDGVRVPFNDLQTPENSGTSVFWRASPKLGLTYLNADHVRLYASIGSGFRAPAALELACSSPTAPCPLPFSLGADPPLNAVVAWNSEVGAEWEPTRASSLQVNLFDTRVQNDIVFVSSGAAAGYFQNLRRTRRTGLETSGNWEPRAGLTLFASYALLKAAYQSSAVLSSELDSNTVTPGDQFALTPRHIGNAGLHVAHAFRSILFDGTLSTHVVSSQFLRGDEGNRMEPLPGYAVGNLQLSLERAHARLTVDLENVLNRRYEVFGVYATNSKPLPGTPVPSTPNEERVERFLTPAYPRAISVSVTLSP